MDHAPASLLSDFPRGDPARPADQFLPPNSTFRSSALMRRDFLAWQSGKVFLGVVDGTVKEDEKGRIFVAGGVPVGVEDDRHLCTFAGSRAGKGRAVIVPNMLHYPGSILVTDPKGELASMTARRRVELGQAVHVLDPFGVAQGYPHNNKLLKGFNPIEAMREDVHDDDGKLIEQGTLVEDAALISDALVVGGSKDPHWDESARAFIEGVVLHVRTSGEYEDRRSLFTVRELIGKAVADKSLAAEMRDNDAAGGVIQSAAADFFDRPDNEKGSVLSTARRHLKFIDMFRDSAIGHHTLEVHSFDLDALKRQPTTIYLCLPARHIGTCNRWLRLFVNLTLQSMERTRVRELPGKVPVLCILDEFATLGHMKQIEDAAGQIAGFGVKLWPILQDLGQLKALYAERWETFLGNSGIVQFFGNNDLTTLEWIAKRCGRTSIIATRTNELTANKDMSGEKGQSTATEIHDLLTPDEAARFFGRDDPQLRQLVIYAGLKSPLLVLQRAYYDRHDLFRKNGKTLFDPLP